jgi:hypothetical protein
MAALQASGKCSRTKMYAENNDFPDRPDALLLNLIWNFETTSSIYAFFGNDAITAAN